MIRFAEINDLETLAALDKHISPAELKRSIESRRVLIAQSDGKITGWLRYGMFWDNTPFMNMLYVNEEQRGKGIGTALCELWESKMYALGFDIVLTSTLSDEQAQNFYRKHGYRDCGSLILPGQPLEIIMIKTLAK